VIDERELLGLLAALVRAPSENPPGAEAATVAVLEGFLTAAGVSVRVSEVAPGRPNLVAAAGEPGRPALLLTGHSDTVPAGDGWTADPFSGEIRAGRLHGRGAADMKGGLAAMAAAVAALAAHDLGVRILFAACVDEEDGGAGTRALVDEGVRAEWAVIGEPTALTPIVACKGNCYFEVVLRGRAAHAGSPERGENAIERAATAVYRLRRHGDALAERRHPLLGRPTLTATLVGGGTSASIVPDACRLVLDRRLLPDETAERALAEVVRAVGDDLAADVSLLMELPAMEIAADHPLVDALTAAARAAGAPERPPAGWTAACDGGVLQRGSEIPTVVYGPGDIARDAHRPDESVPVDEVVTAARTYVQLAHRFAERVIVPSTGDAVGA
jgi:acetylornithine deacetylase/succinyl-diaminopimelate desuccinylase family protein